MSAGFRVEQANTLEQVEAAVRQDRLKELVLSPETLFEELPELEFAAFCSKALFDGQRVLQRKLGSSAWRRGAMEEGRRLAGPAARDADKRGLGALRCLERDK